MRKRIHCTKRLHKSKLDLILCCSPNFIKLLTLKLKG